VAEMSGMSDILTMGLVLILVFGSACLYLYTRIQQAETKINLLESILLDLKMTNELKAYPTLPMPVPANEHTEIKMTGEPGAVFTEQVNSPQLKPFVDHDDEDLAPGGVTGYTEKNDSVQAPSASPVTDAPYVSNESGVKVSPNYEAMTLKELRDLAKERKLQGTSTLKRNELVNALKQSDSKHSEQGMLESMAVSDITSNAEELEINA
jgi:hypothetical protein